ncbi:aminotransferase-like domain-containing protein [Yinghuangia soli]|uniref:PLP-dependent aminotransferase family protein n=1 Tax=Yinghuangia soli TaxID=2908204 RepID=A0AA41PXH2_9ACTN|nr:PLP-dependent aminotransferase family protein [Yinghuangia soli]MCF2527693.1 PLP-dependent aminotransferase family protein [Yinghuangia soli]
MAERSRTQDYRRVADAVEADIAAGRLRAGDRLPPQRDFARAHAIANSTAARVYGELTRRGLVVGEVGRGTYVRAAGERAFALADPTSAPVDLELSVPAVPEQFPLLADGLARMLRPDVLKATLRPVGAAGTPEARAAAPGVLARPGWRPAAESVLFTGNGRQAIAAALAALVPPGGRLGVEELTYPAVRAIAARLGITLVPLELDADGVRPDAVAAAHRSARLHAIYVQPTLHNPMSFTMPPERRAELADLAETLELDIVEDGVWSHLADDPAPPLAAYAPDRTVFVDSLSKRVAPGLTVGFAVPPARRADAVAQAIRSGAWTAPRFSLEAATGWIQDGTVTRIGNAKRADVKSRQRAVAAALTGFRARTAPDAYMCWWELPDPWRADTFVAAAARRGIAVTPGAAFAVRPASAPNAVRLGLASPPPDVLATALQTLASLARTGPDTDTVS